MTADKWPPITDAERARMAVDYSDAAIERRAAELVALHGEEAYERAVLYRNSYPTSHAGHAFYSRVIVRILAPKPDPRLAATADWSPPSEPKCPGPDCKLCNGEACDNCGAGSFNNSPAEPCEHDVIERHQYLGGDELPQISEPEAPAQPSAAAPQWHDEADRRPAAKPKAADNDKQGSLF